MAALSSINDNPVHGSGWVIAWGVFLVVAGVLALLMPAVAALATALFFGWLLILGGGFEIAYAIQTRARRGFAWKLISGLLSLVLGLAVLAVPVAGVASLALLVGSFLLLGGVARSVLAFHLRPMPHWGWILFDGLLSIALAILIILGWPQSSLAFISLLTGFTLIFNGVWRIALGRAAQK